MKKGRARKSSAAKKNTKPTKKKIAPLKKAAPKNKAKMILSLAKDKIKNILPKSSALKKEKAAEKKQAAKKSMPKKSLLKTLREKILPKKSSARSVKSSSQSTIAAKASRKSVSESENAFDKMLITKITKKRVKKVSPQEVKPLPFSYNETRLGLLIRDPFWGYSYWDFSSATWNWIRSMIEKDPKTRAVLRIHNLDLRSYFDLTVSLESKSWYIDFGRPDMSYEAELGLIDSHGKFYRIALSNRIRTPRNTPSEIIDPSWNAANFSEIYQLSGGGQTGRSSELFSRMKNVS